MTKLAAGMLLCENYSALVVALLKIRPNRLFLIVVVVVVVGSRKQAATIVEIPNLSMTTSLVGDDGSFPSCEESNLDETVLPTITTTTACI